MKNIYMPAKLASEAGPDNTVWVHHSERLKVITAPLPELLDEMDCARECDLTTQTFGLIVGVALGRILERDDKAGRDSLYIDWLRKCYKYLPYWTDRNPAAFGVYMTKLPPDAMYSNIASLPRKDLDKRIFYAGLMLGRCLEEGSDYQKFARKRPEYMDELVCMVSDRSWWLEERE